MAEYLIQGDTLTEIADAIRNKTGGSGSIKVSNMAASIAGISTDSSEAGSSSSANIYSTSFSNTTSNATQLTFNLDSAPSSIQKIILYTSPDVDATSSSSPVFAFIYDVERLGDEITFYGNQMLSGSSTAISETVEFDPDTATDPKAWISTAGSMYKTTMANISPSWYPGYYFVTGTWYCIAIYT